MERFRANIVINGLEAWEEVSFEGGHIKPIWTFFFIQSYGYFKLDKLIDEVNVDICYGCHRSGDDQGKKILQGQGKDREFHFKSGKTEIFRRSQGEMRF